MSPVRYDARSVAMTVLGLSTLASCLLDVSGTQVAPAGSSSGGSGGGVTVAVVTGAGAGATTSSAGGSGGGVTTTTGGVGGLGGGGGGGAGGAGGGCPPGPGVTDYVIAKTTSPITMDGLCNEPAYAAANALSFGDADYDDSDNTSTCRFVWTPGAVDSVYGCCTILDSRLEAEVTTDEGEGIWSDDAVEMIFDPDTDNAESVGMVKFIINANNFVRDGVDGTDTNLSQDPVTVSAALRAGSLNDSAMADDNGWSVEFQVDLPFSVTDDQVGKCQFVVDDRDDDTRYMAKMYGAGQGQINEPSLWGTCRYACQSVP